MKSSEFGSEHRGEQTEFDPDRVVIRDKRRIDPVTGATRQPDPGPGTPFGPGVAEGLAPAAGGPSEDELAALEQLAERTSDLQRLQAEYANYRKRVDRDRLLVGELAVGRVLAELVPVLDDIDRARDHGDLDGPFKAVADKLHLVLAKVGVEAFGEVGDPFDPSLHEAVMHDEREDVQAPTVTAAMRKGYKHGHRLLRPAMVGVSEPASAPAEPEHDAASGYDAAPGQGRPGEGRPGEGQPGEGPPGAGRPGEGPPGQGAAPHQAGQGEE